MKRLVVVGVGAVGGAVGGLARCAGTDVVLVARGEHGRAIGAAGLKICMPSESVRVTASRVAEIEDVDFRDGDVALVATKLYDAEATLDRLVAVAGPDLPVVCALNGVDAEGWAAARFANVTAMMVWVHATYLRAGEVDLYNEPPRGVLDAGTIQGDRTLAPTICAAMNIAGFDSVPRTDIMRWKYAKLLVNLGGTAQALVTDDWRRVAEAARDEGRRVLDAAGVDRASEDELRRRVAGVVARPIDGQPRPGGSTWQSRTRGRPLETPWLEGVIVRKAAATGIHAPINAALVRAAEEDDRVPAAALLPTA